MKIALIIPGISAESERSFYDFKFGGIIMKTAILTIILIMVPILSLAQTRDIRDRNDGGLKSSLFIPVDSERSHSQEGT